MNNARVLMEDVPKEPDVKKRERVEQLTDILEALNHVAESSYWKVLKQNVFDVDLRKAKSRLAQESDTTEIFRLQGEIRWGSKFSLEKLIAKYRDELSAIRKQL